MNQSKQIQLSIMMFFQFFVWGTWYVILFTYVTKTLNFSGIEAGDTMTTVSWGAIIAPIFVGIIADRYFNSEKVLGILHIMGAFFLYLASQVADPTLFFWVMLANCMCYMPTLALSNAVAFHQMEDPGLEFPKIRVLGTIGFIVATLLIGFLQYDISNNAFLLGSACSLALGIYSFFLPKTPPKSKGQKIGFKEVLGLDALKLMKDRSFATLVIASMLICIPLAFYFALANIYLTEAGMENPTGKMALGQVAEVLFMLAIPFLYKKWGAKWMIVVGIVAWIARYVLFAYGNNEELVFMLYGGIILHGICYDFFFVTGQIYVDEKAPIGLRASAQGLIALATYGVGMLIGSKLAGIAAEKYQIVEGGQVVNHEWMPIWWAPAAMAIVVLILFLLFFKNEKEITKIESEVS